MELTSVQSNTSLLVIHNKAFIVSVFHLFCIASNQGFASKLAFSAAAFSAFNLGDHVNDTLAQVEDNRQNLLQLLHNFLR